MITEQQLQSLGLGGAYGYFYEDKFTVITESDYISVHSCYTVLIDLLKINVL